MLEIFLKVLLIMAVLLAFIVPGFLLKRFNFLDGNAATSLSNILLYVCQPALVIDAFCVFSDDDWARIQGVGQGTLLGGFGVVAAIAALAMLAVLALSRLVFAKMPDGNKNVYTFVAIFSNCGFLGIPFVKMFTDSDPLAVMYMAVFNIVFIVLVWTVGVALITGDLREIRLKKIACNPGIICSVIGLVLFFVPQINIFMMAGVEDLQILPQYLSYMNAPLSMIIVGIRLADMKPKALFCGKGLYLSSAMRLIVAPLVTFGIALLFFLALGGTDVILSGGEYVLLAPVIAMAMSPAASVVALSQRYKGDGDLSVAAFLNGTLLSIVAIPLMIAATLALWGVVVG